MYILYIHTLLVAGHVAADRWAAPKRNSSSLERPGRKAGAVSATMYHMAI